MKLPLHCGIARRVYDADNNYIFTASVSPVAQDICDLINGAEPQRIAYRDEIFKLRAHIAELKELLAGQGIVLT